MRHPLFYEYRIAQVSRGRSCSGREQQGSYKVLGGEDDE